MFNLTCDYLMEKISSWSRYICPDFVQVIMVDKIKDIIIKSDNKNRKAIEELQSLWDMYSDIDDYNEPLRIQVTDSIVNKTDFSTKEVLQMLKFITWEGIKTHDPNTFQVIVALCINFEGFCGFEDY